ncbi:hypothetical protein CPC08DRAFT_67225 [Agrocybe pediades]|nr:hypothetical protein CPC08DRAFT_67225 [Agrocybe pediades]
MVHLAPELIGIILRNINDDQTLVSSRLVSKSFEAIGAPVVWRKLRIVKPGPSSKPRIPFEFISKASRISPYVKEIEFDTTNVQYPDELLENIPGMLDEFLHFHNFKRLEALCLVFPCTSMEPLEAMEEGDEPFDFEGFSYADDSFEQLTPQRKVRTEILKKLAWIHLEHGFTVRTFTMRGLYPISHTGMHANGLLSFMKSLRNLSITIPEIDVEVEDYAEPESTVFYEAFRKDFMHLLEAATELRTFEYEGDEFGGGLGSSHWDSLTFPHLESLRLRRASICHDSPGSIRTHALIKFILRHQATLKELHLGDCTIDVQSKTMFTWGEVFDIFREELKDLRQFTFLPLPEADNSDNLSGPYVRYDRVYHYRLQHNPRGYEPTALMLADTNRLQALQRELNERQSTF